MRPPFADLLAACNDSTSVVLPTGARFIRKLPGQGSLAFLHKMHAPLAPAVLTELRSTFADRLPAQVEAFLSWANGAELFANQIYLFGFGEPLSRGLELSDQVAIGMASQNEVFAVMHPERWADGWATVGSVVGWDSTFHIDVHSSGMCLLRSDGEGPSRPFATFYEGMETIIGRIAICFSCDGVLDPTYMEVEAALRSLVRDG